ncbi:MAG: penicillin-binding transpeptidase domain-containing protein [Gemmatimonadales bacterium]
MAKPSTRIAFLQGALALAAAAVLAQSFRVSVVQHSVWKARAEQSRSKLKTVPAWRGTIYDRNGAALAVTRVSYHINVAVDQLRDTTKAVQLLSQALDLPIETVAGRLQRSRNAYFHGPYSAQQVNQLRGIMGVYRDPMLDRAYPRSPRAAPLLGGFDRDRASGRGGLEAAYDSLLKGVDGLKVLTVDGKGSAFEGPNATVRRPIRGSDIYLTIDANLQGIAENALERALIQFDADDGDIVVLDVRSGEVLALASLRTTAGGAPRPTASAVVEEYEPGSTAKIFTAAAVLQMGADTAPRSGMGGVWNMPIGRGRVRQITDAHRVDGFLTLGETIKHSSNIAISQFALGLRPEQHYAVLRDFGFGTPANLGFPGEGRGMLRRPAVWENNLLSQASIAQGYEFMSTAVQMASAYAVLANGGTLLRPTLVREIRGDSAGAGWVHHPEVIRRVIDKAVADRAMRFLASATDSGGTGTKAQLDRIQVVGKTGTAKLVEHGQYIRLYRGSFAGVYPGDAPQVVIYVMINKPRGAAYYGGLVAAPVVRSLLQQGLALHNSPLDRRALTGTVATRPPRPAAGRSTPPTQVVAVHAGVVRKPTAMPVVLPAVRGLDVRHAALALHREGLVVRSIGRGVVRASVPAAGETARTGTVVTVYADSTR